MDNSQIIKEIIVQILGFAIVFFVLKRFAWGGLLGMIDNRRKKIEDDFHRIEEWQNKLEAFEKEYRAKLEHIEQEARMKIQEASKVGLELAKDIQDKARHDAEKILQRAHAEIEQDIAKAKLSMRDQIIELSSLITEKVLKEKIDEKEHAKLVEKFIKDLEKVG